MQNLCMAAIIIGRCCAFQHSLSLFHIVLGCLCLGYRRVTATQARPRASKIAQLHARHPLPPQSANASRLSLLPGQSSWKGYTAADTRPRRGPQLEGRCCGMGARLTYRMSHLVLADIVKTV